MKSALGIIKESISAHRSASENSYEVYFHTSFDEYGYGVAKIPVSHFNDFISFLEKFPFVREKEIGLVDRRFVCFTAWVETRGLKRGKIAVRTYKGDGAKPFYLDRNELPKVIQFLKEIVFPSEILGR